MPAKRLFALGVGHVRRRGMEPGSKADELAEVHRHRDRRAVASSIGACSMPLKREFEPDEIREDLWQPRAAEAGVPLERVPTASPASLNERGVIGRFSTFLEHVKPLTHRRAGDEVQRPVPLGRPAGPRDRGRPGGRPVPHHDPRLLARGRPGVRQRQRHGRRPRHREGSRPGPQGGHRRAPDSRSASPSATPTSSGAAAARSSRARSRRSRTASGAARTGSTRKR